MIQHHPTIQEAEDLLKWAEEQNPGPWGDHSGDSSGDSSGPWGRH